MQVGEHLFATGESLLPHFPPPEGFDRAMLLPRETWREADDLRDGPEDKWGPEFNRCPES